VKEMGFNILRKRDVERSETGEFNIANKLMSSVTYMRWEIIIIRTVCNFKKDD